MCFKCNVEFDVRSALELHLMPPANINVSSPRSSSRPYPVEPALYQLRSQGLQVVSDNASPNTRARRDPVSSQSTAPKWGGKRKQRTAARSRRHTEPSSTPSNNPSDALNASKAKCTPCDLEFDNATQLAGHFADIPCAPLFGLGASVSE